MNQLVKTLLTLLLGVLSAHAADLDFRSAKSSANALVQVSEFLRERGYEPRVVDDACLITDRGLHITHKPVNDPKGLDRIVVSFAFGGTGKPTPAKLKAINELNDIFNTCTILLDENGDVIFRLNITFSDILSEREHREFIAHIHAFLDHFMNDAEIQPLRDAIMR